MTFDLSAWLSSRNHFGKKVKAVGYRWLRIITRNVLESGPKIDLDDDKGLKSVKRGRFIKY